MKDPTGEILTAFATALASISYNSFTWPVYTEQPPKGKRSYIYLAELLTNQDNAKETLITDCIINIEISAIKDKYCKTIVNSLSNSIIQSLVGVTLILPSYTMNFSSSLDNTFLLKETSGDTNYIKTLTLHFQTQET